MTDVTRILGQIENGDPSAADQLLPLVYQELRRLAAVKLTQEHVGQTLQATALVHEAYLRLVGSSGEQDWDSRGHFFAAAAESMRRILIERARQRATKKRGGDFQRVDLEADQIVPESCEALLALNEALDRLEEHDETKAKLVKLRYFAGLTMSQAAQALGISLSTAEKYWVYAKTWLKAEIADS